VEVFFKKDHDQYSITKSQIYVDFNHENLPGGKTLSKRVIVKNAKFNSYVGKKMFSIFQ
jgi:hypothetical protein